MEKLEFESTVDDASGANDTRNMLAREFGIKAAFARVDQLAALTGMSSSAIRSQARSGLFPIPHRRVGKAILFKVNDVVAWYSESGRSAARLEATTLPAALPAPAVRAARPSACKAKPELAPAAISREEAARIKKEVLRRMALRCAATHPERASPAVS